MKKLLGSRLLAFTIGALSAVTIPSAAANLEDQKPQHAKSGGPVLGGLIEALPCLTAQPPVPGPFSCQSGTHWSGSWAGHTHFVIDGVFDDSLNFSGTIEEWFTGVDTRKLVEDPADPAAAAGTIHLAGTAVTDSTTLTFEIEERIVPVGDCSDPIHPCTDGAFRDLTGNVLFVGVIPSAEQGYGGYVGSVRGPK